MGDLTLDIPEVQVLVHYPGDANGLNWHHRILLHRVGDLEGDTGQGLWRCTATW